jgi:hypothetical protein
MRNRRGEAATLVLLVVVLLGGAVLALKPKFLHGETKRAEASAKATEELKAAYEQKAAVVSASVNQIGQVASTLPVSNEREFIVEETTLVQTRLPAPDPKELIKAMERKNAILQGERDLANRLYEKASGDTIKLTRELEKANAERYAVDQNLLEVAAAHRAEQRQKNIAFMVAGALGLLWLYTRLTRPSPGALAEAVNDIRNGSNPITSLDGITTRLEQSYIKLLSKLKS